MVPLLVRVPLESNALPVPTVSVPELVKEPTVMKLRPPAMRKFPWLVFSPMIWLKVGIRRAQLDARRSADGRDVCLELQGGGVFPRQSSSRGERAGRRFSHSTDEPHETLLHEDRAGVADRGDPAPARFAAGVLDHHALIRERSVSKRALTGEAAVGEETSRRPCC
jgi:hypothetical protein